MIDTRNYSFADVLGLRREKQDEYKPYGNTQFVLIEHQTLNEYPRAKDSVKEDNSSYMFWIKRFLERK